MIGPDRLDRVSAEAALPEQVVAYVRTVSGLQPLLIESCVGYRAEEHMVLVGYPLHDPLDQAAMSLAIDTALNLPELQEITVIGPCRPSQAPHSVRSSQDDYYQLPIPAPPLPSKLKSLLRRADRELSIETGQVLKKDHRHLINRYLSEKTLEIGTRRIFQKIPSYLEASSTCRVVSAWTAEGRLAAFAIGEYASLHTAFFMFCFRDASIAPPGSADRVFFELLQEAEKCGQTRMNLGLGIHDGIRFFKRKWNAKPFLPCIETAWKISKPDVMTGIRRFLGFSKKQAVSSSDKES